MPKTTQPGGSRIPRHLNRIARTALKFLGVLTISFAASLSAQGGWGRKVTLKRKYRAGQKLVYQTKTDTQVEVRSNPPGLEAFLPPLPTNFSAELENAVTVRDVQPDGTVDVDNRFDHLKLHSGVAERLPDAMKTSVEDAEQEFITQVQGQTVTVHLDREGRLVGIDGIDKMFGQLDEPLREPLREVMRYLFQQMSGNGLYPAHPVSPGDVWGLPVAGTLSADFPVNAKGESTLRYAGKTRYGRVKAEEIDFKFTEGLTPQADALGRMGPLARLESQGLKLDIGVEGHGEGKVLVASKDGHILQNHSTIHQTLTARLTGFSGLQQKGSDPITVVINADTHLQVDEEGAKSR